MRSSRIFKIIANICRLILACTFILSGFTKVVDPWGTALKVNEYLTIYGMEFLQPASMAFSIWLCGAELMMGCMLLFKVRIRLISIFALASMLFFTVLTLLSATVIPVEDCGCFGDAIRLTPWETFLKNLVLLPMAVVVWWRYRPDKVFAFKPVEIVLTCLFFFLSMALGTYCYRHLPLVDFLPYKVGVNIWQEMHASEAERARWRRCSSTATSKRAACANFRSRIPSGRIPPGGSGSIRGPRATRRPCAPSSGSSPCTMPRATRPKSC